MDKKDAAGYILLELLIGLLLVALILPVVFSLYQMAASAYEKQLNRADVQYAAANAMQMICRDIKEGQNLSVQNSGALLQITKKDRIEKYYLSSGIIYKYYKTSIPVAGNISVLSFNLLSDRLVEIYIIAEQGQEKFALRSWCARRL